MDVLNKRKFGFFLLWVGLITLSTLPPRRECKSIGKRNAAPISESENKGNRTSKLKVVGGRKVKSGEFPWLISLHEQQSGGRFMHTCGGSIIRERYILTAAHCINYPSAPRRYKVLTEIHRQPWSTDSHPKRNIYEVEEMTLANFSFETFEHDIALLRLNRPIRFNALRDTEIITLPEDGMEYTGMAQIAGWGATRENGTSSDVPGAVDIPILPQERCLEAFAGRGFSYDTNSMICGGYPRGGSGPCQGDSGGPLFRNEGSSAVLIGIVSFGVGCARPGNPGRYAKVSHYIRWINSNMRG